MNHILDLDKQTEELYKVFAKLQEGNTILFLGAGASVGEKRYLSKELIEYYEAHLGKSIGDTNITRWIDILSADSGFDRKHFDTETVKILQKLPVSDGHKVLASMRWREIITTNFDLLVERAYDEVKNTSSKALDLKTVKHLRQYNYKESNTEVRYVKLNGCIQDVSLYPLAFSTDDFKKLNSFYKIVLNDLKNLSDNISFMSIGYSYTDEFGRGLLEKFDTYNYRERRWIINVDPYPNENALAYYAKNKICIIKTSFQDLFKRYAEWERTAADSVIKKKSLSITNSKGSQIGAPYRLLLNMDGIVRQLNTHSKERFIKEVDFYRGEEPTFNLITRGVDVVRTKLLRQFQDEILHSLEEKGATFVPIFFVTGDFGIGKSTFALRLIYELEKDSSLDIVSFEITDFNRAKKETLIELVNTCHSKYIAIYCDEVEVESNFKTLLDIQRDLSIEQFQDSNVFFIVPIRENILAKYKLGRKISRSIEFQFSGGLEEDEVGELLEKLKGTGLVEYRDAREKNAILKKIQRDFDSDSFISLMGIITSGRHENDLISCFNQLSKDAQNAFLYTALLHKHKLLMPASWLKHNISMDWEEFTNKIVKAEGKGILFQEIRVTHGTQPDLYFRTKHPLIASKLVDQFIPNKDKQLLFYERMLRTINVGQTNSYLVNNLLKAFSKSEEFNSSQINKLFDIANQCLSDDPYFLLNYAINLQSRGDEDSLKKGIETLVYAESLIDYRNHRFIHRRGVLNFELAKIYFRKEKLLNYTKLYLNEAKELFVAKQLYDPCSAYGYVDYIKMLIWEVDHIKYDPEDEMQIQIKIEELFDTANRTVTDGIERINSLQGTYADYLRQVSDNNDYKEYLERLYNNVTLRPYACVLLHNYHSSKSDIEECRSLINEMESYQDNFEVLKFLFKHYGRNLHDPNNRVKLLRLSRKGENLEAENPLRFNYFNFIAETYNYHYFEGKRYLENIQSQFWNLNPEFHLVWLSQSGDEEIFDAAIIKRSGEKYKAVKLSSFQLTVRLIKGDYDKYEVGQDVKVKLHFYLYGLMAEIVNGKNSRTVN
jgi:hypothetical protein